MQTDELVFKISGAQYQRLVEWRKLVDERVFRQELETGKCLNGRELGDDVRLLLNKAAEKGLILPIYSADNAAYVFEFTPTSLGLIVKVKNSVTGDQIDLTDYADW